MYTQHEEQISNNMWQNAIPKYKITVLEISEVIAVGGTFSTASAAFLLVTDSEY